MNPNLYVDPPPVYPNDGPTIAEPKRVMIVEPDRVTIEAALRALAQMPRAADGQQRLVIVDKDHVDFHDLNFNAAAVLLADANIIALTSDESRAVGFRPADRDALTRLHRDGLLVADIPVESIRLAARDNAIARAKFRDFGAKAPDDVVPAKTLRRRQRLAARARA